MKVNLPRLLMRDVIREGDNIRISLIFDSYIHKRPNTSKNMSNRLCHLRTACALLNDTTNHLPPLPPSSRVDPTQGKLASAT